MKKGYGVQVTTQVPGGTLGLSMSGKTICLVITTVRILPSEERAVLIQVIERWTGPGGQRPVTIDRDGKTFRCRWTGIVGAPFNLICEMAEELTITLGAVTSA